MAAIDVWDVLVAAIVTPGSIGEVLDDLTAAKIAFIDQAISLFQFSVYYHTIAPLAANTEYVPAAGTIMMSVSSTRVALGNLQLKETGQVIFSNLANSCMVITAYCDGTAMRIKNNFGGDATIHIRGLTMI